MKSLQDKVDIIRKNIKSYQDFPKEGILFRDVFSVLQKPKVFAILRDVLVTLAKRIEPPIECVVGMDARGFLFGPIIALELEVPFAPIRKMGKLPGKCQSMAYSLEYGEATVEIQEDAITQGQNVLIIDDLLATGGTLKAACKLIEKIGGNVAQCIVVMEIAELQGRSGLPVNVEAIVTY